MLYDLSSSHPSLGLRACNKSQSNRSGSPLLDYHEFVRQQDQQGTPYSQREEITQYAPQISSSAGSSRAYGHYNEQMVPVEAHQCRLVQTHLSHCEICQRYALWKFWNETSHWIVLAMLVFFLLRKG